MVTIRTQQELIREPKELVVSYYAVGLSDNDEVVIKKADNKADATEALYATGARFVAVSSSKRELRKVINIYR